MREVEEKVVFDALGGDDRVGGGEDDKAAAFGGELMGEEDVGRPRKVSKEGIADTRFARSKARHDKREGIVRGVVKKSRSNGRISEKKVDGVDHDDAVDNVL